MTEQEAIWVLKDFDKQVTVKANGAYQSTVGEMACKVAITALEEIQQYRAIGTVEEFRAAREKQRAKKPTEKIENEIGYYHCANCDKTLRTTIQFQKPNYCLNCGQKLDWSEEE